MTPILLAVIAGLVIGFARGGRLPRQIHVRSWPLLLAGVGIQVVSHRLGAVLLSYALLGVFALRNFTRAGMGVLLVGVALNLAPMLLDGGMPVEGHAIVSAHVASAADVALLRFDGKRHLAGAGDHLRALDDTIPDWWSHEVLSFGDIVIAFGVATIIAGLFASKPALLSANEPARERRA